MWPTWPFLLSVLEWVVWKNKGWLRIGKVIAGLQPTIIHLEERCLTQIIKNNCICYWDWLGNVRIESSTVLFCGTVLLSFWSLNIWNLYADAVHLFIYLLFFYFNKIPLREESTGKLHCILHWQTQTLRWKTFLFYETVTCWKMTANENQNVLSILAVFLTSRMTLQEQMDWFRVSSPHREY